MARSVQGDLGSRRTSRRGASGAGGAPRRIVLTCAALLATSPVEAGLFRRGDVNLDGRVDVADPVSLLFHLLTGAPGLDCQDAADFNDDGSLDISDPVAELRHLFLRRAGPPLPGPGPCPGPDASFDPLDCEGGEAEPLLPPRLELWLERAGPPGSRQRQGRSLPVAEGAFRVEEGVSFVLVVEAGANFDSRLPVSLHAGGGLIVECDADLGEPGSGGLPAGLNLAGYFGQEIETWSDPLLLTELSAWRVDATSTRAPGPGEYRFRAVVSDAGCATSPVREVVLEVLPSTAPRLALSLLDDPGASIPDGELAASLATGNMVADAAGSTWLVVDASRSARSPRDAGDGSIETSSFRAIAMPLVGGQADPDPAPEDISHLFQLAGPGADGSARWVLPVEPSAEVWLSPGNTLFSIELSSRGGDTGQAARALEIPVSYARDVQPLWNRDCSGCHEPPGANRGLELVLPGQSPSRVRRNLVHVFAAGPGSGSVAPLLVWPHRVERSYLVHKLRGTHAAPGVLGSGGRMPLDGPPYLSHGDLHLVESWIEQGARDD